jgi:hypothetical protein
MPSKKRVLFENAVRARAGRILKDKTRLDGYLEKMGRSSLSDCSDWELRRIMGFLSKLEYRGKTSGVK